MRFDQTYIQTPNTTFAFLRPLALERINVVEIFSTFTELTFILSQADLERAFLVINRTFSKDAARGNNSHGPGGARGRLGRASGSI